jgi:hypothetical protein
MTEKRVDFAYPWSKQPVALRSNLIDMVLFTIIFRLLLTFRFNLSTLLLPVQNIYLLLPWPAKQSSTIDEVTMPTRKTERTQLMVLVNVVGLLKIATLTNGNVIL